MMTTEQDLEIGKEEEKVSKDLPNQGRIMVPGKEAIDQCLQEDPKEALLVEVIIGDILEEEITGNPLETEMTGQDQEIDTEINHHTIREGLRVIPETVIRARMGRGVTETDVKEEALTEVQVRKEEVTEEEMMIVEERESKEQKGKDSRSGCFRCGSKSHLTVKCPIYKSRSPSKCRDCKLDHKTSECKTRRHSNHL